MNVQQLFETLGVAYETLDGQLDAGSAEEFAAQFRRLFTKESAKKAKGLVYVWWTAKPIPRLKDASDVVYIGQTIRTLSLRHVEYVKVESSGGNWERYKHIFQTYGPIRVSYAVLEHPRKAESSLLQKYFHDHLESPPLNGTTT